jgi:hypothetical protein
MREKIRVSEEYRKLVASTRIFIECPTEALLIESDFFDVHGLCFFGIEFSLNWTIRSLHFLKYHPLKE